MPIVIIDAMSMFVSLAIAQMVLQFWFPEVNYALHRQLLPLLAISALTFPVCRVYSICGLHPSKEFRQIATACVISFVMLLVANMMLAESVSRYETTLILTALALALFVHPAMRLAMRTLLVGRDWWGWPVLVVGDGEHGRDVYSHLNRHPMLGMRPAGLLGPRDFAAAATKQDRTRTVVALVKKHRAHCVVIALSESQSATFRETVDLWSSHVKDLIVVPAVSSVPTLWTETQDYGGMFGIHSRARLLSPWRLLVKRCLDVSLVLLAAPLVLPPFVLICGLIKWFSPGPVFFGHERIGRDGRKFKAWKFRSMIPNANAVLEEYLEKHPEMRDEWERDHKLKDDPRVVPGIGNLIRKLSLDELPQLWNVLKGEMSLVGPRPIVDAEIEKYQHVFPLYLKVTPGITGLWQVSGRNNTTYDERINYDAYYVRNWSPWLDVYILARTIKTVLLREGAY